MEIKKSMFLFFFDKLRQIFQKNSAKVNISFIEGVD